MIRILLVALAVSMATVVLSMRQGALANGAAREIFRGRQGAYELVIGVRPDRPLVGRSHFTITPLNAKTSLLVLAATIKLVAYDPDGQPTVRIQARNTPLSPRFYDADIDFAYAGEWTLWVSVDNSTLARIHRRTSLGTALEEASGCSSESGIMVLEQKPARKQGAPNRCCHRTNPTVSASSLTTIAWWPMVACSCRPP